MTEAQHQVLFGLVIKWLGVSSRGLSFGEVIDKAARRDPAYDPVAVRRVMWELIESERARLSDDLRLQLTSPSARPARTRKHVATRRSAAS